MAKKYSQVGSAQNKVNNRRKIAAAVQLTSIRNCYVSVGSSTFCIICSAKISGSVDSCQNKKSTAYLLEILIC